MMCRLVLGSHKLFIISCISYAKYFCFDCTLGGVSVETPGIQETIEISFAGADDESNSFQNNLLALMKHAILLKIYLFISI